MRDQNSTVFRLGNHRLKTHYGILLCLSVIVAVVSSFAAQCRAASKAQFIPLGVTLFGDGGVNHETSYASAVSPNGEYVVGYRATLLDADYGRSDFIWSRTAGARYISELSKSPFIPWRPTACDVADNGTVLMAAPDDFSQSYLWSEASGITQLGENQKSRATAISADGQVAIGSIGDAAYWRRNSGWATLGDLPIAPQFDSRVTGRAMAISSDGGTIVGLADYKVATSTPLYTAFRWSAADGMQDLGVSHEYKNAYASAVSRDGSVIAGTLDNTKIFRWTAASGAEVIASGAVNSNPLISDNGQLITWTGNGIWLQTPRIWTRENGVQNLQDVLVQAGADMKGWTIAQVRGLSADGRTFVGVALDGFRNVHGFVATLPVPEPGGLTIAASLAMCGITARRRTMNR